MESGGAPAGQHFPPDKPCHQGSLSYRPSAAGAKLSVLIPTGCACSPWPQAMSCSLRLAGSQRRQAQASQGASPRASSAGLCHLGALHEVKPSVSSTPRHCCSLWDAGPRHLCFDRTTSTLRQSCLLSVSRSY